MAKETGNALNAWDAFWREYMVWANRLIAACSNIHFFHAAQSLLPSPWLADVAVLLYSFLLCQILGLFLRRGRAPGGPRRNADGRDAAVRRNMELTLKETFLAYAVNTALGVGVAYFVTCEFDPVIYASIGAVMALLSPAGAGLMAARNVKTGRPDPGLIILGLSCIGPGMVYATLTLL